MPTANLRLNIRSMGNDDGATRQLGNAVRTFGNNAGRLGRLIGRSGRSGSLWVKAAVLFAPALFTLAKAALAGAGGLIALAAVVSAAALPWIALAITAARNADRMGGAGRRFEGAATRVGDAWMELTRRTASLTLGPAVDVLNGIAAAIPKMEPLVRQVAPIFAQMGADIQRWLQGDGLDRFLQNINDFGVPAFRNLVDAGTDFIATVGIAFRAFLPMARDMGETFARAGSQLRNWAQGGGFTRFVNDVRNEWPTVRRFLDEAGTFFRTVVSLLDDLGPGQLSALSTVLRAFNLVDPDVLRNSILALFGARLLIGLGGLLASVAAIRASGALSTRGAAALMGAAASLSASGAALHAMAAAIRAMAARVATSTRVSVNSDALDRIREIWDGIKGGGTATFNASSVNMAVVAMMGVASTAAALMFNAAMPATFTARADAALFNITSAILLTAWIAVRVMAFLPVLFRGMATPGNVLAVAGMLIGLWNGVRVMAAIPVVFRATANGAAAIAGMARAVAAWRQLSGLPRSWSGTATANVGGVVSGSSATVSAWRSVLALPRSWSAVASVVVNGGFGGLGGGGSVTVGGGGGGGLDVPGLPGGLVVPGFGGRIGELPFFDTRDVFGDDGIFNFDETRIGGIIDDIGGFIGGLSADDFGVNVFDDVVDFFFAEGGQVGRGRYGGSSTGRRERHVHVHGDIWVRNQAELEAVLEEALAQLD